MTVDLKGIMKSRDAQVAEDVRRMYELGRFDKEFALYGTCFLENDEVYYYVNMHPERVYDLLEQSRCQNLQLTPVEMLLERCAVPIDAEDEVLARLKVKLAKQMREKYPKEFLRGLDQLAALPNNNSAEPWLDMLKRQLEGVFDADKLQALEGLLDMAYASKIVTEIFYQQSCSWLAENRRDMSDDEIAKGQSERTFYGFAAWEAADQLHYYVNAQRQRVYQERFVWQLNGQWTTPVFYKTYTLDQRYKVGEAKRDYEKLLGTITAEIYAIVVPKLYQCPSAIDRSLWQVERQSAQQYSPEALQMLQYYSHIWQISDDPY